MRICIPIPCFFGGMDFCEAIAETGELGFDCEETYNWKDLDLDKVRATCEETGVELRCMCTTEFRLTDPAFRKEWLAGLRESCEAAKRVGASSLITPGRAGHEALPRAEQHAAIVETLKQAKPMLGGHRHHHHARAAQHHRQPSRLLPLESHRKRSTSSMRSTIRSSRSSMTSIISR